MGKYYFTKEQVEILKLSPYVKNVSEKAITYTDEFKLLFLNEYKINPCPSIIFEKYGLSSSILGQKRISENSKRWRRQELRVDGIKDTRKDNSGRPITRDLTAEEQIKRLKDQNEYLRQQVEFLSQLRRLEKEVKWKQESQQMKNTK
jgi:hypothetical protein